MNDAIRMQISAFVDGELPDNEADLLLRRMGQDVGLRQKVAQYLAIGRAMRGEASVSGVDRIHERVSAALDDKPIAEHVEIIEPPAARAIRPLVGVAVAATVALLAIFGLQQIAGVDDSDVVAPLSTLADSTEGATYTAPERIDEQLRQYYISHGAENGDSFFDSRDVTGWISEEAIEETSEDKSAAHEDSADATGGNPKQP